MSVKTTWRPPHAEAGKNHNHRLDASERNDLPESAFALPEQRKLPVTDAAHVRAAMARFDQVEGITDTDRELAFAKLRKAAEQYGVEAAEEWVAGPGQGAAYPCCAPALYVTKHRSCAKLHPCKRRR